MEGCMTSMIVLMAGLAVGSDGTEQISTETGYLAIEGCWEGIRQYPYRHQLESDKVRLEPGQIILLRGNGTPKGTTPCKWIDEGRGKCQLILIDQVCHGIYKRERGQLVVCYGDIGHGRPTSFHPDETQTRLILKQTKPPGK
jgi:hypothetical protein